MANYSRRQNTIMSFVAMAFILYFIALPLIMAAFLDYFGSVEEIITNVIELIPFGETYFALTIQFVNSISGRIVSYIDMTEYFTMNYLMEELAKGLFTIIIFEALKLAVCWVVGFVDGDGKIKPEGVWNKAKYLLITVSVALIAACFAPFLLNYIFSNLYLLGKIWSVVISLLVSVILVGGGITFFLFLLGLSIAKTIIYVIMKFFVIGVCRISCSYVAILFILICWQQHLILLSASGMTALFVIGLMLGEVEMIVDSVF